MTVDVLEQTRSAKPWSQVVIGHSPHRRWKIAALLRMASRCLTGGDSTSIQEDQDVGAQLTGSDGTQVAGSGQRQPVRVAPELHHVATGAS